jgi:short-subunit dehydrogenase
LTAPSIVIIGASSAIAEQIARLYATQQASFFLVARNQEKLTNIANDLKIRGAADVSFMTADLGDFSLHPEIVKKAIDSLGNITHLYIAHGTLPDTKACEENPEQAVKEINLNQTSTISLILYFTQRFVEQKSGTIAVLSSVAGDRGRQSNYIYGAAKGGLSVFLQGLRNRLFNDNVKVVTVKPGFVDTPMTANFKKGLLWVSPEKVARSIVKGVDRQRDSIYVPGFWRIIMLVIIHIPEFIFKRLKL